MTIFKRAIAFTVIVQLSCHGQSSVDKVDGSLADANRMLIEYITRKDTNALTQSYRILRSNDEFLKEGMTIENRDFVTSLLMYLRKYDELENLIARSYASIREKELTLNLIRSLKIYETDSLSAYRYIEQNIVLIKDKLRMNPKDSLLYVDYFVMRIYQAGRQAALSDLDSLKLVNDNFSHEFYEYVLRDVIEEYPDEYLFPKE